MSARRVEVWRRRAWRELVTSWMTIPSRRIRRRGLFVNRGVLRPYRLSWLKAAWRLSLLDWRRTRAWHRRAAEARQLERVEGWRRPPSMKPCPRDPTVIASWGTSSEYVLDCPEARTPAWWRARLPLGATFRLALHPLGTDDAAAMRRRIDLGTWSGLELPAVPIGVPPAEVLVDGPRGRASAALSTVTARDGRPTYVLPASVWSQLAPERQVRTPPKVRVDLLNGRKVVVVSAGTAPDAMPVYVEQPATARKA